MSEPTENKFDIHDYRWSWSLSGMMAGAKPIETDWPRTGVTASHHELGEGHPYLNAQAYSNGTFRQLVLVGLTWFDCLMIRTAKGVEVLEKRIVSAAKVAHVAHSYGIVLNDSDGTPVLFDASRDAKPKEEAVGKTVVHKIIGKEYDLAAFTEEVGKNCPTVAAPVAAFLAELSKRFRFQFSENPKYATVYPYINANKMEYWPIALQTNGKGHLPYNSMSTRAPWSNPDILRSFVEKLPMALRSIKPEGKPSFSLDLFADEAFCNEILAAVEYFVDQTIAK